MAGRSVRIGMTWFIALGALVALGISARSRGEPPRLSSTDERSAAVPSTSTAAAAAAATATPRAAAAALPETPPPGDAPVSRPTSSPSSLPAELVLEEIARVRESLGGVVPAATKPTPPNAPGEGSLPSRSQDFDTSLRELLGATSLAAGPTSPEVLPATPDSTAAPLVELLRDSARSIESAAADLEDSGEYAGADRLRQLVHQLRIEARRWNRVR